MESGLCPKACQGDSRPLRGTIRRCGRQTEDESVWEPGSAAWNAVETAYAKFLEKNGGKPDGAAKWLTKPNGLRDIYMQMYTLDPTCTLAKRKLNGYLDEKLETFDRIGDNDPHASRPAPHGQELPW